MVEPLLIHYHVFRPGAAHQPAKQVEISDPCGTTIGALKQRLFAQAIEEEKEVRFIARGRNLEDSAILSNCGLDQNDHIHVMVRDHKLAPAKQSSVITHSRGEHQRALKLLLAIALIIIGGVAAIYCSYRKRFQLSLKESQAVCIGAAVWVFAV